MAAVWQWDKNPYQRLIKKKDQNTKYLIRADFQIKLQFGLIYWSSLKLAYFFLAKQFTIQIGASQRCFS